uniref:Uncharacterized protein n=1 Tax=Arundo donax TaxID=35708 RepID=A0A0A9SB31_ARUDO
MINKHQHIIAVNFMNISITLSQSNNYDYDSENKRYSYP